MGCIIIIRVHNGCLHEAVCLMFPYSWILLLQQNMSAENSSLFLNDSSHISCDGTNFTFFLSHPGFHSTKNVFCGVLGGCYGSSLVTQCLFLSKQIINFPSHTCPVIRASTRIEFPFSWQHSLNWHHCIPLCSQH